MGIFGRLLSATLVFSPLSAFAAAGDESVSAANAENTVDVRMGIGHRGPRFPWILRLDNVSDEPVRVAADPRLLSFKAAVPGKRKPVDCTLPSDVRPAAPVPESIVELQPGERVIREFDPRFFCFTETEQETLVPGTVLETHYGWPTRTKTYWRRGKRVVEPLPNTEPYFARPASDDSERAPLKNVEGNFVTLGNAYRRWSRVPEPRDDDTRDPEPTLRITRGVDAHDERNVIATIVLHNPRKTALKVFLRRELITFEVFTPLGRLECNAAPDERSPTSMAYSVIRPGGSTSLTSRVVELCPRGTFGRPGFYRLHARFDATVSGPAADAYTGTVMTRRAVPVRVRNGELPFLFLPERPKADPATTAPTGSQDGLPPTAPPSGSHPAPEEPESPATEPGAESPDDE